KGNGPLAVVAELVLGATDWLRKERRSGEIHEEPGLITAPKTIDPSLFLSLTPALREHARKRAKVHEEWRLASPGEIREHLRGVHFDALLHGVEDGPLIELFHVHFRIRFSAQCRAQGNGRCPRRFRRSD